MLADQAGSAPLAWAAVALYLLLLTAWATAFANTLRGAWSGAVFVPAPAPPAAELAIAHTSIQPAASAAPVA